MSIVAIGFLASLIAGSATGIGAIPVLFTGNVSDKLLDIMLGFSAGVMLAASFFSLLLPAIDYGGVWMTVSGFIVGIAFLHFADRFTPHMHLITGVEGPSSHLSWVSLLIIAITIHNFPEGLAVGVSFGGGDIAAGTVLAIGIAIQNMPEGLAVALPLIMAKLSKLKALAYATLTGLVEPVGGLLGVSIFSIGRPVLPFGLSFAAGAMIFVVADEIIPESHRKGHERSATFGLVVGFVVMMLLDTLLK